MLPNQADIPPYSNQQPQSYLCPKHNEPAKGFCLYNGQCEERVMCRLCRVAHDNSHLNYYEDIEYLFGADSVVGGLKTSLEDTLNVIKTLNSTYENNSDFIISQINYLYKEIETNILQKLVQMREMLNENTTKKLEKNNTLRQEILDTVENMTRKCHQAEIAKLNPPSIAEDMVQAISLAQLLKDRIKGDLELQSHEAISYNLTKLATTVSGSLFQVIKLSLNQVYQDISNSFSLESVAKLPSVSKEPVEENRTLLLECQRETGTDHKQIMFGGLAYVASKEEIVTAGTDGWIQILNATNLETKCRFKAHEGAIARLLYLPEKDLLLSAGIDGKINIWDYQHEYKLLNTFQKHTGAVYALDYFDTDLIFSGGEDERIRMWNVHTCQELQAMKTLGTKMGSICRLGDTKRIAVGFNKGHINILSVGQVKKCVFTLKGHNAYVFNLAYIEDQKLLISGAEDGLVIIWKIMETMGTSVRRLAHEEAVVRSLVVFPEYELVITNSDDNHVRIWKISTGQQLGDYDDKTFGEGIVAITNNDEIVTANHNQVKKWSITL